MKETIKGMVSIVVPTNRSSQQVGHILDTINSTFPFYVNIEAIVVADGVKIDNKIINKYPFPVKIIELKENSRSVSIPRAIGITHSSGEFIAPTDDDVYVFPLKFFELVRAIQRTGVDLVYGDMLIKRNGSVTLSELSSWNPLEMWGVDGSQYIYRESIYRKMPLVFCRRACDWETAKSIANHGGKIAHTHNLVSMYTWHGENRSLDESTKHKVIYPSKFREHFNMTHYTADFKDV